MGGYTDKFSAGSRHRIVSGHVKIEKESGGTQVDNSFDDNFWWYEKPTIKSLSLVEYVEKGGFIPEYALLRHPELAMQSRINKAKYDKQTEELHGKSHLHRRGESTKRNTLREVA